MASGIPVIASSIGGIPQLMEAPASLFVPIRLRSSLRRSARSPMMNPCAGAWQTSADFTLRDVTGHARERSWMVASTPWLDVAWRAPGAPIHNAAAGRVVDIRGRGFRVG